MFEYVRWGGQSRSERTWPRPRSTRHVWVRSRDLHPQQQPDQGLIVAWRKSTMLHRPQWQALCVIVRAVPGEDPIVVQRWVSAKDLRPAPADPNRAFGLR